MKRGLKQRHTARGRMHTNTTRSSSSLYLPSILTPASPQPPSGATRSVGKVSDGGDCESHVGIHTNVDGGVDASNTKIVAHNFGYNYNDTYINWASKSVAVPTSGCDDDDDAGGGSGGGGSGIDANTNSRPPSPSGNRDVSTDTPSGRTTKEDGTLCGSTSPQQRPSPITTTTTCSSPPIVQNPPTPCIPLPLSQSPPL